MKTLLVSIAAVAALTAAAPAAAKNGNGHGGQKASKHQRQNQAGGYERERLYDRALGEQRFGDRARGCPPGLAKKNNGCLPPGQAKKRNVGDRLPSFLSRYNVPAQYQDRYYDTRDHSYRYEGDSIYRVNRRSGIIENIISVLGL